MIIDEGEAEAQTPSPVYTIRILDRAESGFPAACRVEVAAEWRRALGGVAMLDRELHVRFVKWVQQQGWRVEGEPDTSWLDVEGERVRALTFTVTGYLEGDGG